MTTAFRYVAGDSLFASWKDDVLTGKGPVIYTHGLPEPEIAPGIVSLIGGAPASGKTAYIMQVVTEAMRAHDSLRVLVANVEVSPSALLERQLARLSGIKGEVIRHRAFEAEHHERLDVGLATLDSFADRLAFLLPPYDLRNVAMSADEHRADVIVLDYIQRFLLGGDDDKELYDPRLRANAVMDKIRQFAASGCAVLVLSAVGRSKDHAGRSTYAASSLSLASFRDSGELESGADDAYVLGPIDEEDRFTLRLAHLKARHRGQRSIDLRFDGPYQSFSLIGESSDAKPSPKPASRRRRRKGQGTPDKEPKGLVPHPDFTPERLAELFKKGAASPAGTDAVADLFDGASAAADDAVLDDDEAVS